MPRLLLRAAALLGCVLAVTVCGEQGKFPTGAGGGGGGGGGTGSDVNAPVVKIKLPAPPLDTVQDITDSLKFTVADTDDVRLKSVQVTVNGIAPYTFAFIDSANPAGTGYSKSYAIPLTRGGAGKHVVIAAIALDPTGNLGLVQDTIKIVDQKAPQLALNSPAGATTIGAGGTLKIVSTASDISGVLYMGARLFTLNNLNQRVVLVADSNSYAAAPSSKTDTITMRVPASVAPGNYLLQSFVRDSSPTPNDTVSGSAGVNVITVLAPFGSWVFPPADTAVVAGDNFLASFRAQDSAGVTGLSFTAYSVHGDSSLGTFSTSPRYTAIGAQMTAPLPRDTTIRRIFQSVPDSSIDSAFIAATVTNIGGVSATIRRRIQVIKGPFVLITKPVNLAKVPTGVADSIGLNAYSPSGIQWLGFQARGVATAGDSIQFAAPYAVNQSTFRFLTVPANTALGVDTIVPFAVNGLGVRYTGKPILVAFADTVRPVVTMQLPVKAPQLTVAVGDSVFVQTHVTDNRGVVLLDLTGVARRGSVSLGTDTSVTRYTERLVKLPQSTDTVITRYLRAATPLDSTGEFVNIIATATDSSGNKKADTTQVRLVSGPKVTILTPGDSAVTSPNKILTVSVHAKGTLGVKVLGWRATGVVTKTDSITPSLSGLTDTLTFTSNLTIPSGTPVGQISITAFAVDSNGNPSAAITPRTVFVQSTSTTDVTPPLVVFTVPLRAEAGDTVAVVATDPGGLAKVGFIARDSVGTVLKGDSATFPGVSTYISQKFRLNLDSISTFPRLVKIEAFAVDSVGNRGVSSFTGVPKTTPADQDTVTIVAGTTITLPAGSSIGDAIVNPNKHELYLSNTPLDQLEVFDLSTIARKPPIAVGAQPVGIALWPHDTTGHNADTVIVANSGGTNLSIVDVSGANATCSAFRSIPDCEVSRHVLPNYIVETVKTTTNAGGGIDVIRKLYDFSDRPQYLGATCQHVTGGGVCDTVIAVYSTAPTPAQPSPFVSRGYLAWENLSSAVPHGHFFWEQADIGPDTVEILGVWPSGVVDTVLGAGMGSQFTLSTLGFQDSTFIRNSGDFNHAVIGEGGLDQGFARAMMYDARSGFTKTTVGTGVCPLMTLSGFVVATLACVQETDAGVSAGVYVHDFLVNRASVVRSVATNFNGRTNFVRADSMYAFDLSLKQSGLIQIGSGNPGMDFDPSNAFDAATRTSAGLNKNSRLVFAARPDASIEVFDTYWYQPLQTNAIIPVRDTIIGPIRVAVDSVLGKFVLAGVTTRGVVLVQMPFAIFTNTFLVRQPMLLTAPTRPRPRIIPPRPAQVLKRSALQ